MEELIAEIRNCTHCLPHLVDGVNPVLAADKESRIAIIGQAPGKKVHLSGVPWEDKSGDRLREWLHLSDDEFYDTTKLSIVPMGFCYPGKGISGDLPPRPECAPLWHGLVLKKLPNLELILLIGAYAQKYYLGKNCKRTLTETVKSYREYLPRFLPLPHPSPRNNIWLKKNDWFMLELIPELRQVVHRILKE